MEQKELNFLCNVNCYVMSNDAKKQSQHVHKQQSQHVHRKTTQFYGPTRAWFLFGPNNNFFSRSQWWASSRAQPIGSPLADRPTIQRCGAVLVIQRRGACTQPAHLVPSRRPDLRAVAWREGMIGRLTLGARVRRNPAGFRGVLSWSTGFRRLWLSITNFKKIKKNMKPSPFDVL